MSNKYYIIVIMVICVSHILMPLIFHMWHESMFTAGLCSLEWMNEWCNYIVLYCVLLYTQSTLQSCGGGGGVSPGWCNDCHRTMAPVRSPHTSYRWRGERDRANQVNDWQGPVEGTWPGHRGYTPTLYEKCHGIFNDHRESGPWFNVSSERRCLLTV